MFFICCTNKVIIGTIHQIPDFTNLLRDAVHIFLWRNTCFLRLLFNFLPMFVRPGLKEYLVSFLPFKTRHSISQHNFVRISNMRLAGCIDDCSCNIIIALLAHILIPVTFPSHVFYIYFVVSLFIFI